MKKRHFTDDFARQVDALYARALAGKPFDAKDHEREVLEVAFALARLRILIDGAIKQTKLSELPGTALIAASDLLNALMKGTNHPIWRYISEGKAHKRINKAPASVIDSMRRAWIVGILRSLQNDALPRLSRRRAAKRIAEHGRLLCAAITSDQIIGWDKYFCERNDPLPDAVREDILRLGGRALNNEETILKIGLGRADFLWPLPGRVS